MADDFEANAGSGGDTFGADEITGVKYPRSKLIHGADGVNDGDVSTANPLPVDVREIGGASVATGGGVESGSLRVTMASDSTGVLSVDDNGGAITVDWAGTAPPIGAGVEATALRVTIATDSTGVVSIDDNGAAITVDGTVAATQSGTWNVTNVSGTVSLPTGASTLAEQQSQTTALQLIDNVIYVDDADWTATSSSHALVGGIYQSTPGTITDGDTGPIRLTANGAVHISDAGGSVTVDNGGTFAVQAAQSGTWNVTNVSGTVSLPTGASTLAEQQTQTTALQLIDNLVLAEDAAHGSADPGVQTLAVRKATPANLSDTDGDYEPLQMSAGRLWTSAVIDTALPAGTNAIGKLAANSGVDIGDVDVTSVIPGTGATNLGKAIDSVAGATDTGVAIVAIRDDSLSALTPAEGDWTPLRVSSTGALHVTGGGGGTQYAVDDVAGGTDTGTLLLAVRDDSLAALTPADGDYTSLRVSSTGALHVTGGGGGTEYTEDVATANPIVGTATMMERDDALATLTPIEGDWAAMRCSSTGALWVSVDGTVTVGSHAVTNAGTFAVQAAQSGTWAVDLGATDNAVLDAIAASVATTAAADVMLGTDFSAVFGVNSLLTTTQADDVANTIDTFNTSAFGYVYDGTTWDRMRGTSADGLLVNLGSNNDVTITSGTVTTVSTVTTCSTVTTVSTLTGGGIAHDAADSGNPHKIGMKATGAMTARTLVAADDRTDLFAGLDGVAIVRPHAPLEDLLSDRATNTDGASTAMAGGFAAPGANIRLYLTTLIIANSSATAVTVDIRDGAAGSVLLTVPVPADTGGVVVNLPVPLKFTANTALAYDASAAVTTLTISVLGFKSKAG